MTEGGKISLRTHTYSFYSDVNLYYQHLFNTKENSIKKLWDNLNMVCSFKKNKTKTFISKIVTNSKEFTDPVDNIYVMNSIDAFAMLVKNLYLIYPKI